MNKEAINWFFFLLIEIVLLFIQCYNLSGYPSGIFANLFIMGMNPYVLCFFQFLVLLFVCFALKLVYKISTYKKLAYFIVVAASTIILYFPFHYLQPHPIIDEHARRYVGTREEFKERSYLPLLFYLLSVSVFFLFVVLNIPKSKTDLR